MSDLRYAIETIEIERHRLLGAQRHEETEERGHLIAQLELAISTLTVEADKTMEDIAAETKFWAFRDKAMKAQEGA